MLQRCLLILALACLLCPIQAASAPDWLKPYLTPESLTWKQKEPAVMLMYSMECRMISATQVQVSRLGAIVVHNSEAGSPKAVAFQNYVASREKITNARAWIIDPKGHTRSISRSQFSDTTRSDPRFWDNQRALVFKPDDLLKEGSVLAWEITAEEETGALDTQDWVLPNLLTRWAQFRLMPIPGSFVSWHCYNPSFPNPVIDSVTGSHTWTVEDIGPAKGSRPSGFLGPINRVSVRISSSRELAETHSTWRGFAQSLYPIVSSNVAPAPEIKAKAESLCAGKEKRWDKIRALAEFVQADVSYLSITRDNDYLAGFRPQSPSDALKNRYGDCKDKAALMVSLLKSIGEDGRILLLFATNPLLVSPEWPAKAFNHAITAIPAGTDAPPYWPIVEDPALGKLVIVDVTTPRGALGILPHEDQAGHALLMDADHGSLLRMPTENPSSSIIKTDATVRLELNGDASVEIREKLQGQTGIAEHLTRERMKPDDQRTRVERHLHQAFALLRDLQFSESWDAVLLCFSQEYRFKAPRFGRRAGADLLLVTASLAPDVDTLTGWRTETPGTAFLTQQHIKEEVRIELPSGVTVSELPAPLHATHGEAKLDVECTMEDGAIIYRSYYLQPASLYSKSDYDGLRALRQKCIQAQKTPLILKLPASATKTP